MVMVMVVVMMVMLWRHAEIVRMLVVVVPVLGCVCGTSNFDNWMRLSVYIITKTTCCNYTIMLSARAVQSERESETLR